MNNLNIKTVNLTNYEAKFRSKNSIKFIVIHYTGMQSEVDAINRLSNIRSKVSCHYLIDRKGSFLCGIAIASTKYSC